MVLLDKGSRRGRGAQMMREERVEGMTCPWRVLPWHPGIVCSTALIQGETGRVGGGGEGIIDPVSPEQILRYICSLSPVAITKLYYDRRSGYICTFVISGAFPRFVALPPRSSILSDALEATQLGDWWAHIL